MARKAIIGVMGGNDSVGALASDAKLVGASIARSQNILLTGGCCIDNKDIKNATMQGAKDEELEGGSKARLVGILPKAPRVWDETQAYRLFLSTNLCSKERDAINGVTPDALIFFAGSSGTLCELTF